MLTSDQMPWRDLQGRGVGWDLPLQGLGGFVVVLDVVTGWSAEQPADCRFRAFADDHMRDDEAVQANRRLFEQAPGLAVEERG